jgi:SPP1 gp7 family putative phage head morphogenesis protein
MANKKYWSKRAEYLTNNLLNKGEEFYDNLVKSYDLAVSNITKEINTFFMRYAEENKITLAEAKQLLNKKELKEFRNNVISYINKAKAKNYNDDWQQMLENESIKHRIKRLEALKFQMQQEVENVMAIENMGLEKTLKDIYMDGYYKNIYEIQKYFGFGYPFAKLDTDKINKLLAKPWAPDGSNFSKRIWGDHRPQLVQKLNKDFTQAIIRGDAPNKIISQISKEFDVAKSRAANLIQTESAYFASISTRDAFKETGIEKYEILATLDNRTSEICQEMDGKVFSMSEYEVGITAPPFHNFCRTTYIPIVDDDLAQGETRIAKDNLKGKYKVPANITYKKWFDKVLR